MSSRRRIGVVLGALLALQGHPLVLFGATVTNVVKNTSDNGTGSFRQAILDANGNTNPLVVIQFSISHKGVQTIAPTNPLPVITRPVIIDGFSQVSNGYTGPPMIELDGASAGSNHNAIEIWSGGCTVQGLIINRFNGSGIALVTNDNNIIRGNYVGTDSTGANASPNQFDGIQIVNSSGNEIGGINPGDRNIVSGNKQNGVSLLGGGFNEVLGNYIGADVTGTKRIANLFDGVVVNTLNTDTNYATNNIIGGSFPGDGNVISGNGRWGVSIFGLAIGPNGPGPTGNQVLGNYIGVDASGLVAMGNTNGGVQMLASSLNYIGGTNQDALGSGVPDAGNVISGNFGPGISITQPYSSNNVVQGNLIGTDPSGFVVVANHADGIYIQDADSNTIGGFMLATENLISGNSSNGVIITGKTATGNVVEGNLIGLNVTGTAAIGNVLNGVLLSSWTNDASQAASGNTIGSGNVIWGNHLDGVQISMGSFSNQVVGNEIGMNPGGTNAIGNFRSGIAILDSTNNTIGGRLAGQGNVISGNISNGVYIGTGTLDTGSLSNNVLGNQIGIPGIGNLGCGIFIHESVGNWIGGLDNAAANIICCNGSNLMFHGHGVVVESGTNNAILSNRIFSNSGRGIDLHNDSFDVPGIVLVKTDANNLAPYPIVKNVFFDQVDGYKTITWTLAGDSNQTYLIQFFANTEPDPSGFGEGESRPVNASLYVQAGPDGHARFTNLFFLTESNISATATETNFWNTSEFAPVDTDGDGIPDAWETRGVDFDEDGVIDLVLTNANPYHKDVFVEIDALAGQAPDIGNLSRVINGTTNHSTGLSNGDGFANAPNSLVQNPDGRDGINLHLELDQINLSVPNSAVWYDTNLAAFWAVKSNYFGTAVEQTSTNATNMLRARSMVYHYCLFANTLIGYSNRRDLGKTPGFGNATIIALGTNSSSPSADIVPTCLMHELGHSLGLFHAGWFDSDENDNFKPNYHSIMNYFWAHASERDKRVADSWRLDYSREIFPTLDESNLNESVGLDGPPSHTNIYTMVGPPGVYGTNLTIVPEAGPIDWNGNTNFTDTNVSRNVSYISTNEPNPPGQVLAGSEDWSHLTYYFVDNPSFNAAISSDLDRDLPSEVITELDSAGTGAGVFNFSVSAYTISETGAVATITVTRAFEEDVSPSVSYATQNGTAVAGVNYTATSGTLNFTAGATSLSFNVAVMDDRVAKGPLTVQLLLSNPTGGATLGARSTATLTILDTEVPTQFVVINTNDSGTGSLRWAITNANATPGNGIINFNITNPAPTITLASTLPTITNTVTIDGSTQPGYAGAPLIELDGTNPVANGLTISAPNCVIKALTINRFSNDGIDLLNAGKNTTIQGCYIGLTRSGLTAAGNRGYGVEVNSQGNMIGGTTLAARNYISGNAARGIWLAGSSNQIAGCVIGLGVDGSAQGNGAEGIYIVVGNNLVGGTAAGAGNIISANKLGGINVRNAQNTIQGNFIGPSLTDGPSRGNVGNGITLIASAGGGGEQNLIGGSQFGAGNVISGNLGWGIQCMNSSSNIIEGNWIGTDTSGTLQNPNGGDGIVFNGNSDGNQVGDTVPGAGNTIEFNSGAAVFVEDNPAVNNSIRGNTICSNSFNFLGIDLGQNGAYGSTPNDPGDADTGPNNLQNYPILAAASNSAAGTLITGTLNSISNMTFTVDFYASATINAGQGQFWLGSTNVTTDGSGNVSFNVLTGVIKLRGQYITATATDPQGNTSEFSPPVQAAIAQPTQIFTVINTADSGPGSLRQAILDSDANLSLSNVIQFNIPGSGAHTITPLTVLPTITVPVLLDGYSQPGSSPNTLSNADNAVIKIELSGASAGAVSGLTVSSGNSIIRGLAINNWGSNISDILNQPVNAGIELEGGSSNQITGNFIGTDPTGLLSRGNKFEGILVFGSSTNVIGGTTPDLRNLICGTIDPTNPGASQFVAGDGVGFETGGFVPFSFAAGNVIEGNFIGVGADGLTPIGNQGYGVRALPPVLGNVSNTIVGGTSPGAGNVIAYSGFGSLQGPQNTGGVTDPTEFPGNAILGNSMHDNYPQSIHSDNVYQSAYSANFPFIGPAISSNGTLRVQGRFNGFSNSVYRIEFFASATFDLGGFGPGQTFLGFTNITTDSNGFASFTGTLAATVTNGAFITATATDTNNSSSSFSPRVMVGDVLTNVLTVNTTDDADNGRATAAHTSLREAIMSANNSPGVDTIRFAIGTGLQGVNLINPLPPIANSMILDATTQPGYAGKPLIDLDVPAAGAFPAGFRLYGSGTTIRGFIINDFTYGIYASSDFAPTISSNVIEGNYIGIRPSGTSSDDLQLYGIYLNWGDAGLRAGGGGNRIGGVSTNSRNVISGNSVAAIYMNIYNDNVIEGNYIGVDATGTNPLANAFGQMPDGVAGIWMENCVGTQIGGPTPAARNVISDNWGAEANIEQCGQTTIQNNFFGTDFSGSNSFQNVIAAGVWLTDDLGSNQIQGNLFSGLYGAAINLSGGNSVIQGNLIGTDATGTRQIGLCSSGVNIAINGYSELIGGTTSAARNVIVGANTGISLFGWSNTVQGNFIGVAANGVLPIGTRTNGNGIFVQSSWNLIGGTNAGAPNLIAYNTNAGIYILAGTNNALLENSIFSNGVIGIDLDPVGVTPNDPGDSDTGPNNLQNFPILASAQNNGVTTVINGSLNSASNTQFRIELFSNPSCSPSGNGEGKTFLGAAMAVTDGSGNAPIAFTYSAPLTPGLVVTATATDPANNTSEFSPCVAVVLNTNQPVSLSISGSSSNFTISWPLSGAGYLLEEASNLTPPVNWQVLSNGFVTNGGNKLLTLTNNPNAPTEFFRLQGQ